MIFRVLTGLLVLETIFLGLLAANVEDAPSRAILLMGISLVIVWVGVCGSLMVRYRQVVRRFVRRIDVDWRVKFVLFATLLALIEEAITTSLSNLAPVFGVAVGEAYITASPNYLEVVTLHSVVVFIPMFIGWAWLLSRYDFQPGTVFLLFGITGTLAEMAGSGMNIIMLPLWTFVYGLMIYLPAYSLPEERSVRQVRWFHYPLGVILPLLCAIPVGLVVFQFHPTPTQFDPLVLPPI